MHGECRTQKHAVPAGANLQIAIALEGFRGPDLRGSRSRSRRTVLERFPPRSSPRSPEWPVHDRIETTPTFTSRARSTSRARRQVPPTSRSTTAAAVDRSGDGSAIRATAADRGHPRMCSRCSGGISDVQGCTSKVQGALAIVARRRHNPLHSIGSHSRSTRSEFCVHPHGRFMAGTDRRLVDDIVTPARGRFAPAAERRKSLRASASCRCRFWTLAAIDSAQRRSRSAYNNARVRSCGADAGAVARPLSAGRTGACGPRRPSSRAGRRWRPPCRGRPPAAPRSRRASARRSDSRSPP